MHEQGDPCRRLSSSTGKGSVGSSFLGSPGLFNSESGRADELMLALSVRAGRAHFQNDWVGGQVLDGHLHILLDESSAIRNLQGVSAFLKGHRKGSVHSREGGSVGLGESVVLLDDGTVLDTSVSDNLVPGAALVELSDGLDPVVDAVVAQGPVHGSRRHRGGDSSALSMPYCEKRGKGSALERRRGGG